MDEYKKMFESMDRNGNGEIPMIQFFKIFSNLPEFRPLYGSGIKGIMRALSVYINTNTENSVDSIENSFGSVEYWLIKINFEKFLELMEKSLLLLSFQFVGDCCPTELDMIWIEKMFPFIAKDGNSLSMAEFDQFMKKAKFVFQDVSKFLPLYSGSFKYFQKYYHIKRKISKKSLEAWTLIKTVNCLLKK